MPIEPSPSTAGTTKIIDRTLNTAVIASPATVQPATLVRKAARSAGGASMAGVR